LPSVLARDLRLAHHLFCGMDYKTKLNLRFNAPSISLILRQSARGPRQDSLTGFGLVHFSPFCA
jgi:hypothetical protein